MALLDRLASLPATLLCWTGLCWVGLYWAGLCCTSTARADDWLQWRGNHGDNHAPAGANPPIEWDLERGKSVVWKTPIPGAGHSSPIIVGDSIYLTTAEQDKDRQLLLEFARDSGRLTNTVVVHDSGLPQQIHPNNTHASPTVASDGQQLYVVFHNANAIRVTAYDDSLRKIWHRKVTDFQPVSFQFGYGASPLLFEDRLIVAAEYDGPGSGLYAFNKDSGQPIWNVKRPSNLSFSSPIVTMIAGKHQLLLPGADMIQSFDPLSGKLHWTADASTEATCGTVVWDDRQVFINGGSPQGGTWSVLADGSAKLMWENRVMSYEQSMLADRGYLYAVSDAGVGYCWKADNGTEMWKRRFSDGFSSSPLLAADRIYAASESGEVIVYRAVPDRFQPLATNRLGDEVFATPVALGDRLYVRYAVLTDQGRQEFLAALGDNK